MNNFFSNNVKSLERTIKGIIELEVKQVLDGKGDTHYIILDDGVEAFEDLYVYNVRLINGHIVLIDVDGKGYNIDKMYYNEFPLQAMAQIADLLFETKYTIMKKITIKNNL